MTDYTEFELKRYGLWSVYLHANQKYLGRCYIGLHREGQIDPYRDTTPEERAELEVIVNQLSTTLTELYQPDLLNYANFRNTWHHCHWHVIPRYSKPRLVHNQEFTDDNWGKNYAPYDRTFEISSEIFEKIRIEMTNALSILS